MLSLKTKIERILNTFENDSGSADTDYASIYMYHDGNNDRRQVTLARGFTDDGGNLKKVVERYIAKGGARSDFFETRLNDFGKGRLDDDAEFIRQLSSAADEPQMQEAQDEIFEEEYLQPAFDWAARKGFILPLSLAVIADSFLHSGGMLSFLMNRFPEKKPVDGGDEKEWVIAYLEVRKAWLKGHSNEVLRTTIYRPKLFLGLAEAGNWDMDCPIEGKDGVQVC